LFGFRKRKIVNDVLDGLRDNWTKMNAKGTKSNITFAIVHNYSYDSPLTRIIGGDYQIAINVSSDVTLSQDTISRTFNISNYWNGSIAHPDLIEANRETLNPVTFDRKTILGLLNKMIDDEGKLKE